MKRMVAALVTIALVAVVLGGPTPAMAWQPSGRFVGDVPVGTINGSPVGSAFAPVYAVPPAVVYQPAPVYIYPGPVYGAPPPTCDPPQWVWNGYGWVLHRGYCPGPGY